MAKPRRARSPPATVQAALIALLVLLATIPVTTNAFITLDDGLYLGNPLVASGLTPAGIAFAFTSVTALYWHPLAWLSHEIDAELYGTDPAGHYLTSVLLHALAAGLLFLVLRRLTRAPWIAAAGALLWALHPLRVESFAWIAERKDVLCALFFIAAILAYLRRAERPSRPRLPPGWSSPPWRSCPNPPPCASRRFCCSSTTGRSAGKAASRNWSWKSSRCSAFPPQSCS